MTAPDELLQEHSLLIRDGRIVDILPRAEAQVRYAPTEIIERAGHLLMPGLVGARTDGLLSPPPAAAALASLLRGGVTCLATLSRDPAAAARVAVEQGLRTVLGLPIATAERAHSAPAEQITEALALRDAHKMHPLVSTAFAPDIAGALDDAIFERIATLVDELDCPLLVSLHASAAEIAACMATHRMRPIERLQRLGLLTPSLNAAHMVHVSVQDVDLALQGGISITLCPSSDLERAAGTAPSANYAAHRMRLGLGGDPQALDSSWDPWLDMKLLDLLAPSLRAGDAVALWDILAAATAGGAAALGIDHETGSLQAGKWADICCLDLAAPTARPQHSPMSRIVRSGGRDLVSDVWVAGRQLLSEGLFTRFERR